MPSEDVYKVSLFYHTSQRQMIATHYYEVGLVTTTDPFEEAQALADAFDTAFTGLYQDVLSTQTQMGCIKVEQVKGLGIPSYVKFYSDVQGNRVGDPLPANITMILRRRGVFSGKTRRSLLHIGGVTENDTTGSFLNGAWVATQVAALLVKFNDGLVATAGFNNAQYGPVIPVTGRVYARNVPVTVDVTLNQLTLTDGTNWSDRGFISGGGFRIAAPNKNKGTYTATIIPASAVVTLSDNELELAGPTVISVQQVTVPTTYITLQSAVVNTALRQLKRRRSSHTGVVA